MATYMMKQSYGGLGYNDIMNMSLGDIFTYHTEVSNLIEKENKANKVK